MAVQLKSIRILNLLDYEWSVVNLFAEGSWKLKFMISLYLLDYECFVVHLHTEKLSEFHEYFIPS
jgi:hypothetical protein